VWIHENLAPLSYFFPWHLIWVQRPVCIFSRLFLLFFPTKPHPFHNHFFLFLNPFLGTVADFSLPSVIFFSPFCPRPIFSVVSLFPCRPPPRRPYLRKDFVLYNSSSLGEFFRFLFLLFFFLFSFLSLRLPSDLGEFPGSNLRPFLSNPRNAGLVEICRPSAPWICEAAF